MYKSKKKIKKKDSRKKKEKRKEEKSEKATARCNMDESLSCNELIGESSDLWPEIIPGIEAFQRNVSQRDKPWLNLESEDFKTMGELARKTRLEMLEKVKELNNLAYLLGLEESKEITRGKYLEIFKNNN